MWETLDNPQKSRLSLLLMVMSMLLIGFSTSTFCLETTHEFYETEPSKDSWLYLSEVRARVHEPDGREWGASPLALSRSSPQQKQPSCQPARKTFVWACLDYHRN